MARRALIISRGGRVGLPLPAVQGTRIGVLRQPYEDTGPTRQGERDVTKRAESVSGWTVVASGGQNRPEQACFVKRTRAASTCDHSKQRNTAEGKADGQGWRTCGYAGGRSPLSPLWHSRARMSEPPKIRRRALDLGRSSSRLIIHSAQREENLDARQTLFPRG